MGVYPEWWGLSTKQLVRRFKAGEADNVAVCSAILQSRAAFEAARGTRRIVWATWVIGLATAALAGVDIYLKLR